MKQPRVQTRRTASLDRQAWEERQNRKDLQREERDRILGKIKKDSDDLKRRGDHSDASTVGVEESSATPKALNSQPVATEDCHLQVRLFDGSSVRSIFSPLDIIRSSVRPWLDKQYSDGTHPYTLKHTLTPLLNHSISISEEEKTLANSA